MNNLLSITLGTILALFFLLAKAGLRWVTHGIVSASSDLWLVPAWFGVDLCVVSFCSAVVAKLLLSHSYESGIMYVMIWVVLLTGSLVGYGLFVKRRRRCRKKHPARDLQLAWALTLGLFCGCIAITWTAGQFVSVALGDHHGSNAQEKGK